MPAEAAAGSPPSDARFMGMEPQPFLVEAFIGHIYSSFLIPATDVNGVPYSNAGNNAVIEDDAHRSTVIVVQIANPYNKPINFDDPNTQFQVRVFGQDFDLANVPGIGTLQPASEDQPATLVLYAIKDNIDGTGAPDTLEAKWLDFLDISINDLVPQLTGGARGHHAVGYRFAQPLRHQRRSCDRNPAPRSGHLAVGDDRPHRSARR